MSQAEASSKAEEILRQVIADGPKIQLDHYLVYHAREWVDTAPDSH
jgi:hypothetical protein